MGRSIIWFRSTHGATDDWATRFCHLLSFPLMLLLSKCFSLSTIFFFFSRYIICRNINENIKCSVLWIEMWICQICIPGSWPWMRKWSCKWMARKRGFWIWRYFLAFKTISCKQFYVSLIKVNLAAIFKLFSTIRGSFFKNVWSLIPNFMLKFS